jgi:hypothetical protein
MTSFTLYHMMLLSVSIAWVNLAVILVTGVEM